MSFVEPSLKQASPFSLFPPPFPLSSWVTNDSRYALINASLPLPSSPDFSPTNLPLEKKLKRLKMRSITQSVYTARIKLLVQVSAFLKHPISRPELLAAQEGFLTSTSDASFPLETFLLGRKDERVERETGALQPPFLFAFQLSFRVYSHAAAWRTRRRNRFMCRNTLICISCFPNTSCCTIRGRRQTGRDT